MEKVRKILVPLDGSAHAEEIFSQIEILAREWNASVAFLLLRVVYDKNIMNEHRIDAEVRIVAEAEEYLEQIEEKLRARGLVIESHTRYGAEAKEILAYAARNDIDAIAIITHGRGGMKRFFLGSVAEKVLRHSPKPVYLVPCNGYRTH